MAGRMISGAAALAELVRVVGDGEEQGVHRVLPVVPELSGLLPGRGLRRGSTVAVATGRAAPASGGTSLMLALLAEASRSGSWCAVVGVPALGAVAAAESGIALERLALVPNPGPEWPTVVAALIDGVDVVVAAVPGVVSGSIAGRLVARARQRGCVLVPFGHWDGADVTLRVTDGRWEGLGAGRGRLRRRVVTILARGRGAAARPREATMWMPGVTVRPFTIPPPPATADQPPDGTAVPEPEQVTAAGAVRDAAASDGLSAVSGGLSAVSRGLPAVSGGLSAASLGLPAVSDALSAASSGLSAVSGGLSAVSRGLPAASGELPAASGGLSAASGGLSAASGGLSAASRGLPAASGGLPVVTEAEEAGQLILLSGGAVEGGADDGGEDGDSGLAEDAGKQGGRPTRRRRGSLAAVV